MRMKEIKMIKKIVVYFKKNYNINIKIIFLFDFFQYKFSYYERT